MKALKKYRWPLTGALLGVLVFLAVYGVRVLDPTSVDWILTVSYTHLTLPTKA